MSPSRTRRPVPRARSRREIVKAVAVAAAIVGVTALLIWLLRPGPSGTNGTGGLFNRQPRASWLVALAVALAAGAPWWILRVSRRLRRRARLFVPAAWAITGIAAVVAAIFWPGGLVRHWPSLPKPIDVTRVPPTTATPRPTASAPTTAGR